MEKENNVQEVKKDIVLSVRNVQSSENEIINSIVSVHLNAFPGFFLTFMGKGFLNQMYRSYCEHEKSGLIVAELEDKAIGFLAYSSDFSNLYKYMIKTRLILFAWYSLGAFLRKPSAFFHIISAFLKPSETKRNEKYTELASIGVDPKYKSLGIGTQMIEKLKKIVDFKESAYITLETDAKNNESAIRFYEKNGFVLEHSYVTAEGRCMNEYRFYPKEL